MFQPDRIFRRRPPAIDATGEESIEEINIEIEIGVLGSIYSQFRYYSYLQHISVIIYRVRQ